MNLKSFEVITLGFAKPSNTKYKPRM